MEYTLTIPNVRNSQVVEVTKRAAQRMGELFQKLKARSGSNFTVE